MYLEFLFLAHLIESIRCAIAVESQKFGQKSALLSHVICLSQSDARADSWEWMRERILTLAHLIGSDRSHDLKSAPENPLPHPLPNPLPCDGQADLSLSQSIYLSCDGQADLSLPMTEESGFSREQMRERILSGADAGADSLAKLIDRQTDQIDQMCHKSLISCYLQEYMNKARENERYAKAANLERDQTELQLQVILPYCYIRDPGIYLCNVKDASTSLTKKSFLLTGCTILCGLFRYDVYFKLCFKGTSKQIWHFEVDLYHALTFQVTTGRTDEDQILKY